MMKIFSARFFFALAALCFLLSVIAPYQMGRLFVDITIPCVISGLLFFYADWRYGRSQPGSIAQQPKRSKRIATSTLFFIGGGILFYIGGIATPARFALPALCFSLACLISGFLFLYADRRWPEQHSDEKRGS